MDALEPSNSIKLVIYYASYLYFPASVILVTIITRAKGVAVFASALVFICLSILAYARFVEPRILLTKTHDITLERCFAEAGSLRLAVFSDTHNGIFGNAMPIVRIARRVERIKPDAVLVAGDFTYHPDSAQLLQTYAAFNEIAAPVLGVFGNHDVGFPGPDLTAPLTGALTRNNVSIIDNRKLFINKGGRRVELIGISDEWQDQQRLSLITPDAPYPRIVLTHNPATVLNISVRTPVDLLIAGHTHGGQIYIPFVTCKIVSFACRIVRYGFSAQKRAVVFVTSGTGMVGLPMRFNMAPRIDVVTVRYNSCRENRRAVAAEIIGEKRHVPER